MERPTDPTAASAATPARRIRRIRRAVGRVGGCLVCALWPLAAAAQDLIANQNLGQHQLTRNEARLYFTLRLQQWPDGHPVRVFVLSDDNPLHIAFTKDRLGLFPYQLRGVWDRQVFSGTGQAPTSVASEEEMIQRVAATPGGVGYVWSAPRDPRVHTLQVR